MTSFLKRLQDREFRSLTGFVSFSDRNLKDKYWLSKHDGLRFEDVTPDCGRFKTLQYVKDKPVKEEAKDERIRLVSDLTKQANALDGVNDMRCFIDKHNLNVKKNVGGYHSRTKLDMKSDILHALLQRKD